MHASNEHVSHTRRLEHEHPELFVLLVLVAHAALCFLTLLVQPEQNSYPFVYAASGIYWMALALSNRRQWLVIIPIALLTQTVSEILRYDGSPFLALAFSISRSIEVVLSVLLLQYFVYRKANASRIYIVTIFLLIAVVGMPALLAALPAIVLGLQPDTGLIEHWVQFTLMESVGILILGPLVLLMSRASISSLLRPRYPVEKSVLALLAALISWYLFFSSSTSEHSAIYLIMPVIIWAAGRFGLAGAIVANVLLATVTAFNGAELFDEESIRFSNIAIRMDFFLLVTAAVSLLLAAYAEEHDSNLKIIEDNRRQLQELSLQLSRNEERFRNRIATLLHDSLGQNLALNRIRIDKLKMNKNCICSTQLDEIAESLGQIIQASRDLTHGVADSYYRGQGLEKALEEQFDHMSARSDINFQFNLEPLLEVDSLRSSIIFRAVREVLINIVKHAHASTASLKVYRSQDRILVEVGDDGVGFDASTIDKVSHTDALGLANIKNAVEALGGHFSITSCNAGTDIKFYVPSNYDVSAIAPGIANQIFENRDAAQWA